MAWMSAGDGLSCTTCGIAGTCIAIYRWIEPRRHFAVHHRHHPGRDRRRSVLRRFAHDEWCSVDHVASISRRAAVARKADYTTPSSESNASRRLRVLRAGLFAPPNDRLPLARSHERCPGPWLGRVVVRKRHPAASAEMLVGGAPAGAVWTITSAKAGIRPHRLPGAMTPPASRRDGPDPSAPRRTAP